MFFRQNADHPHDEWTRDLASAETVCRMTKVTDANDDFIDNHLSPDGKYCLSCIKGLQIYELVEERQNNHKSIAMKLKEWTLPLRTDDFDKVELASRVRFESNSVIRFVTRDNRDLLYKLHKNGKRVDCISEVKIDKLFKKEGSYLKFAN